MTDSTHDDNPAEEAIDFSGLKRIGTAVQVMIDAMKAVIQDPSPENQAVAYALWEQRQEIGAELRELSNLSWVRYGGGRCPFELRLLYMQATGMKREHELPTTQNVADKLLLLHIGIDYKADTIGAEVPLSFEATLQIVKIMTSLEQQHENPSAQHQWALNIAMAELLKLPEIAELEAYTPEENRGNNKIFRLF